MYIVCLFLPEFSHCGWDGEDTGFGVSFKTRSHPHEEEDPVAPTAKGKSPKSLIVGRSRDEEKSQIMRIDRLRDHGGLRAQGDRQTTTNSQSYLHKHGLTSGFPPPSSTSSPAS